VARLDEINSGDAVWHADAERHGWSLPTKAPAILRISGIRWMRFVLHSIRVHRAAANWASVGIGIGGPNQYDRWVLWAIYRGWC
jgi:hypothetical protein